MLLERYDLNGEGQVVREDYQVLSDHIDGRKAYFTKLHRVHSSGKVRNLRNRLYRRGNIFANRGFSQRVVVKAHYKKHSSGGAGAGNLRGHLSYITRDGAGVDKERPDLFGSKGNELERTDFYHECKNDRHHFRLIISPENGHEIDDFEGYIVRVMDRVQEDLDTKLSWVSAVHYDTDNHHAHVVLRGKDDQGKDLVIAPDYISFGIRGVAQEVVAEILGERSIKDINKSMEKETDVMRVTSLDRFIASRGQLIKGESGEAEEIRIKSREIARQRGDAFYNGLVQRRLVFLASASMARVEAHGVYFVRSSFMEELKEISEKNDIIKQLYRTLPDEALDDGVSIYKIVDGNAPVVQGRIEKIAQVNELTDHKYMALRDGIERLHYVPLAPNTRSEDLEEGMIVEVSASKATGRADKNILDIASENGGVYTREAHMEHVRSEMEFIEDPESYVDYHGIRLDTLERAEIIRVVDGGYMIPDDALEQGKALNAKMEDNSRKRHYAKVKALSHKPILEQIDVHARTWLDLEIYRHQNKYDLSYSNADKQTLEAIHKRQDWLLENGYGHHKSGTGEFMLRGGALDELYKAEIDGFGEEAARRIGAIGTTTLQLEQGQTLDVSFVGYVDLHSGHHVVVENNNYICVVKASQNPDTWALNEPVSLKMGEKGLEIRSRILDKSKEAGIEEGGIDIDF